MSYPCPHGHATETCSECMAPVDGDSFERGRLAGLEEAAQLAYGYVCVPREKLEAVFNSLAMDPGDIGASFWNGALRRAWKDLDAILAEGGK